MYLFFYRSLLTSSFRKRSRLIRLPKLPLTYPSLTISPSHVRSTFIFSTIDFQEVAMSLKIYSNHSPPYQVLSLPLAVQLLFLQYWRNNPFTIHLFLPTLQFIPSPIIPFVTRKKLLCPTDFSIATHLHSFTNIPSPLFPLVLFL